MSRFSQVLSDAAARLPVPEPARSRILLEVAADMEDLHQTYLDRGLAEEEALAQVMEQFDLSDQVLRDLARVHDTPLQRSLETISGQVRDTWTRILLGLVALSVLIPSGRMLLQPRLYSDAGSLVWPVLILTLLGLGIGAWKAYGLFPSGGEWRRDAGKGLGTLLTLAGLQVGLACAGLWIELYRSALEIRAVPGEALVHLIKWAIGASAILVIALSGALLLGSIWFLLRARARRIEETAVSRLLEVTP
jgi:hypothetical protein